ncbi:MAG: cytidine deaminase [Candidatus Cryptobacteroides sp.]
MTNKEIKISFAEYLSLDELEPQDRRVAEAAIGATASSYAPYSGFNVGAAVMLEDGQIITGSNQENAAYPSGLCAERTAMFYAGANNPDKAMLKIAVAGGQNGILCDTPATPCGACRQVMAQYQHKSGKPMEVILIGKERIWKFSKVDDILPLIFDSI